MTKPKQSNKAAFIKTAEAYTNESRWESRLKAVAKPPAKPAKKGK